MPELSNLEIFILRKLYRHGVTKRYKPVEWVMRKLPSGERDMTKINKAIKHLMNLSYVVPYKKGACIFLNHEKIKEIRKIIE